MEARTLLGIMGLVWFCPQVVSAQISPGPLSRAHQHLEGVVSCSSCHNFRAGPRALKCVECHTEIQHRIAAKTGYHARAVKPSSDETDCARCHAEHNGQKFPLIRLDRQTFNHAAETGFALQGKHAAQKCEACHNAQKISAAAKLEIKLKDPNASFLGLRRECLACHADQHRGQLGVDCAKCHTQDAWKPVTGFNHSGTQFPLTGLHQQVACSKCHAPRGGTETLQFKGVAFAGCQNCHNDPHHGAFLEVNFRGGCQSCHNTGSWKKARPGSGFDHDQTQFKLAGKHAELACAECHKSTDFHREIPHERCQQCHEDPHKGQFAARAAGSDCVSCHNERSFKPAKFDRQMHQQSAFKLEGKHAALDCGKCHQPAGRGTVYITRTLICSECHADPHAGEFASAPEKNQCNLCHTQESFRPPAFTVASHSKTRFPLTGRHAAVECSACHKPLPPRAAAILAKPSIAVSNAPDARRQYHFANLACASCHQDPHRTRLACETCHETKDWKQPLAFDHAATKFPLDSAHAKVACAGCHKPADHAAGPLFGGTSANCVGCHLTDEVHGAQFQQAARVEDCSACHSPARWKIDPFDHDKTRFPLDRAHRNVTCEKCHKERAAVSAKPVRVYRDTPTDCVKCH